MWSSLNKEHCWGPIVTEYHAMMFNVCFSFQCDSKLNHRPESLHILNAIETKDNNLYSLFALKSIFVHYIY